MADLLQFLIMVAVVFIAGVWFGAVGLNAAQQEQKRKELEQEWQDWERRHG